MIAFRGSSSAALTLALILVVILAACAPAAPSPTVAPAKPAESKPAPTSAPAPAAPAPTTAPAAQPTSAPAPTSAPGAQAAPTSAPAAPKPAPKMVELEYIQVTHSPSYLATYVAQEKGFFAEEGISIKDYVVTRSSPASAQAITAGPGSAVIGPVTSDTVITAIDKGAPLKLIGATTLLAPYRLLVTKDINKIADLKGKVCGASTIKTSEVPLLKAMLATAGLQVDRDYSLTVIGVVNDRINALLAGAVACTVLTPPFDFQTKERGGKQLMEIADIWSDYQFVSMTVNTDWAAKNRDTVVRFMRSLVKAGKWLEDPKNRDEGIKILVKYQGSDEKYAPPSFDTYFVKPKSNSTTMMNNIKGLERVIEVMKESDTFPPSAKADFSKYVDNSYWEEATGQKVR